MIERLTISDYIKAMYEEGVEPVDCFFSDSIEFGYEPADLDDYQTILVDTLDDMYGELVIDKPVTSLNDLKNYVISAMKKAHQRYEYMIRGWWDTMQLDDEYNPLDNVNETWTDKKIRLPHLTTTDNGGQTIGSQTNSVTNTNTENTYNDLTLVNDNGGSSSISNGSRSDTSNNTRTETGSETITYERNRHGNIGVTTSGQLLEDYRRSHSFNFYEIVGSLVVSTFTRGYQI